MACPRIKIYFTGLHNRKEKQNMKLSGFIKLSLFRFLKNNFLTV